MATMTSDEMLALLATLTSPSGEIELSDLGAGLAHYARPPTYPEIGRRMAKNLAAQGAMYRSGIGRYRITERGRIAAALILFKNPDLRSIFIEAWDDIADSEPTTSKGPKTHDAA